MWRLRDGAPQLTVRGKTSAYRTWCTRGGNPHHFRQAHTELLHGFITRCALLYPVDKTQLDTPGSLFMV